MNERQKLWWVDVKTRKSKIDVGLTMKEVLSDTSRRKIITNALDCDFGHEWLTTEHIEICCAVEFHEMTADVACGDQLHQTVALLRITFKKILHDWLAMRLHVNTDNEVFDKLYNLSSDCDVFVTARAIEHKMMAKIVHHLFIWCPRQESNPLTRITSADLYH